MAMKTNNRPYESCNSRIKNAHMLLEAVKSMNPRGASKPAIGTGFDFVGQNSFRRSDQNYYLPGNLINASVTIRIILCINLTSTFLFIT